LSHAIQSVLDKGYDKVIVLGNDSPGLHLNHLQEAFLELQDKSVVLGPDFKGGTYGVFKISLIRLLPKLIGKRQNIEQLRALYSSQKLGITAPLTDCNTKMILKLFHNLLFAVHLKCFGIFFYATPIYTF
jgi:hypothetical protein